MHEEILSGPEYFICEREHCTLRLEACLERQRKNKERIPFMSIPFPGCIGCEQGMENQLLEESGDAPLGAPRRGKGERDINCEHYGTCLDLADSKNWKSFNCESCPLYHPASKKALPAPEKKENTRICEECGERPTITPKHRYCPVCLAYRSNKKRKATQDKAKSEKPAPSSQKSPLLKSVAEQAKKKPDTVITVDFGAYPIVLKNIKNLAEKEVRTISEEIIYIAKYYLEKAKST